MNSLFKYLISFLVVLILSIDGSFSKEISSMSNKGKKLANEGGGYGNIPVQSDPSPERFPAKPSKIETTEDPFNFGDESGSFDNDDDWGDVGGESESFFDEEILPLCEFVESPDIPCTNGTNGKPQEVRYRDPVLSRLISQIWSDFQLKLNSDAALYGVVIDPFDVDSKLPEPIDLQQTGNMFNVDVKMHSIKVYGLSGIRLDESAVTRSENLTDMKVRVKFAFDKLVVNGTYGLKGQFGWWNLDSQGFQLFEISMVNATLTYQMKMDIVKDGGDWSTFKCSAASPDNVLITEIRLPLEYADINFRFDNLGEFANTVVNAVGIYFLKTQEEMLVGEIRKALKKNVNSFIC